MNPWLERALVGLIGGTVSSTLVVTSASKNARRRRRREARERRKAEERGERVPLRLEGAGPGLSPQAFKEKVTAPWRRLVGADERASTPSPAEGRAPSDERPAEGAEAPATESPPKRPKRKGRRPERPRSRPTDPGRRRRSRGRARKQQQDGLSQLKEEAFHYAKTRAKEAAWEKSGAAAASQAVRASAENLKQKGGEVGDYLKDAVPEDLGDRVGEAGRKVGEAGRGALERGKKLGRSLSENLSETLPDATEDIGDKLETGAKGLGRWLQGPGAPDYDPSSRPRRVAPASEAHEVVEAKLPQDTAPDPAAAPAGDSPPSAPQPAETEPPPARGDDAPEPG